MKRNGPVPIDPETRFWKHVRKTKKCWIWTGTLSKGYGSFRVGSMKDGTRRKVRAHKWIYELRHGRTRLPVLHSCDNRPCVRPSHLKAGTQARNVQDAWDRGRIVPYDRRGKKNSNYRHGRYVRAGLR